MDELRKMRGNIKAALTRFVNQSQKENWTNNPAGLQLCIEKNEDLYDKFQKIQNDIEKLVEEKEEDLLKELEYRDNFELTFYQAIGKAKQILINAQPVVTIANQQSTSNSSQPASVTPRDNEIELLSTQTAGVFLPKLSTPKFDGNYSHWVKFRDSFNSLINDNPKLSNIQKYHYSEEALVGNAARVIEALGVSDRNYATAWQNLVDRYEDEDELIHHHVNGLFNAPAITRNCHSYLLLLLDTFNNHLRSLESLKEPVDKWDTLNMYLLKSKLTTSIKNEWERSLTLRSGKTNLKDMKTFLENHCKYLHKTTNNTNTPLDTKGNKHTTNPNLKGGVNNKSFAVIEKVCPSCNGNHGLYTCEDFKKLTPLERTKKARELKVCFNCLSIGHGNKDCKLGPCKRCGWKHNTMLHQEKPLTAKSTPPNNKEDKEIPDDSKVSNKVYSTRMSPVGSYVILATANVYLADDHGKWHECRALLDSCSQPHIITSSMCDRLGLQRKRVSTTLSGIEGGSQEITNQVTVKLKSQYNNFSTVVTYLVTKTITDDLPSSRVRLDTLKIPTNIRLADKKFNETLPINLLIGTTLFFDLLCVGRMRLDNDMTVLQKTLLGWIVTGSISPEPLPDSSRLICNVIQDRELEDNIEKFCKIENCFSQSPNRIIKGDEVDQDFTETMQRDASGRFIVNIPFKEEQLHHDKWHIADCYHWRRD